MMVIAVIRHYDCSSLRVMRKSMLFFFFKIAVVDYRKWLDRGEMLGGGVCVRSCALLDWVGGALKLPTVALLKFG